MELVAFILTEIALNLQEAEHPQGLMCLVSLELSVSCFLKSFPECLHIKVTDQSVASLSLCSARDGLERRHHHLQPDFTVASMNSSRSSNSYNGTGVTAFGVTVKTCFREASVGKLSRKMSFECGNSSSLMVCCQQLRWSNNKRSWAMMSGAKASKLQKFTLNRHILYCNND